MITRPIASLVPASPAAAFGGTWRGALSRLLLAYRTVVSRPKLLEMEAQMLKDIGITHGQAVQEARRMPWDVAPRPYRR